MIRLPITLVLLLAILASSVPGVAVARELPKSFTQDIAWETYVDHEWGYTIKYPRDWIVKVVFTNGVNRPLNVIRKRVRFSGSNHAEINVDVWQKPSDMSLMPWIDENRRTLLELGNVQIPSTTNAMISGQAFVVLTQAGTCSSPPLFFAYIPANDRIFTLQYRAADGGILPQKSVPVGNVES